MPEKSIEDEMHPFQFEEPADEPVPDLEPFENPVLYSASGFDRTQIRWLLSMTPMQRLESLQKAAKAFASLRNAVRRFGN